MVLERLVTANVVISKWDALDRDAASSQQWEVGKRLSCSGLALREHDLYRTI